jgi:hypothetical protein
MPIEMTALRENAGLLGAALLARELAGAGCVVRS